MRLNAIYIKNLLKDQNGYARYLLATDEQIQHITKMRNDPEKRYSFIKIGNITFCPMDIAYIEEKKINDYEVPRYAIERINIEEQKKLAQNSQSTYDIKKIGDKNDNRPRPLAI